MRAASTAGGCREDIPDRTESIGYRGNNVDHPDNVSIGGHYAALEDPVQVTRLVGIGKMSISGKMSVHPSLRGRTAALKHPRSLIQLYQN
jgi:hypothetical protein